MNNYITKLKEIKERFDSRNHFSYKNDDEENLENTGVAFHGNTRLPYGLCKQYGIEIGEGWTPTDAWNALKEKGISPDKEYTDLANGKYGGSQKTKSIEKGEGHSNASNKAHRKIDSAIMSDFDIPSIIDSIPKGTALTLNNGARHADDRASIQIERGKDGIFSVTYTSSCKDDGYDEYGCTNKKCSREEVEEYMNMFYDDFASYSEEYLDAVAETKKFHKI